MDAGFGGRIRTYECAGQSRKRSANFATPNHTPREGFEPPELAFKCFQDILLMTTRTSRHIRWALRDSNPGPPGYEPEALTDCAKSP